MAKDKALTGEEFDGMGQELKGDQAGVQTVDADTPVSTMSPEARAEVLQLLKDPEIANQLVNTVLQTPEGRQTLNIPVGHGRPMGEYRRNYDQEPALRVYGGVEVRHGDDFEPRPPANIPMYVSVSGRTTDVVEAVESAEGGMVHEAAMLDENDKPVKTDAYKMWIDSKMTGKRLGSDVRADIAHGKDMGGHFSSDGLPSFVESDAGLYIG